jgi:hypothetical protein
MLGKAVRFDGTKTYSVQASPSWSGAIAGPSFLKVNPIGQVRASILAQKNSSAIVKLKAAEPNNEEIS